MRHRAWLWSAVIAVGTASFLTLYLVIISRQGNRPVVWFVIALAIGGALPIVGLAAPSARTACLAASGGVLTVLAVLTGFSFGVLLVPVALIAWVRFALESQQSVGHRPSGHG